jgi:hypothetical protein
MILGSRTGVTQVNLNACINFLWFCNALAENLSCSVKWPAREIEPHSDLITFSFNLQVVC